MKYTMVNVCEKDIEKVWIICGLSIKWTVTGLIGTKTANLRRLVIDESLHGRCSRSSKSGKEMARREELST
jgi:hypothetical protein